jgi:hypothetical protein
MDGGDWLEQTLSCRSPAHPPTHPPAHPPTWLLGSSLRALTIIQRYGVFLRWCCRLPAQERERHARRGRGRRETQSTQRSSSIASAAPSDTAAMLTD